MKTKAFLLAAAGALAAATLTACGSGSGSGGVSAPADPASVEGTVDMWVYPVINDKNQHTQFWDKQIAAFQAKYPKIKVKAEVFPWANRDTALQTAIAARKGPDVAYLIPDQIPKYATSIAPVDDLLSPQVKESYLPNVRESVTMNGHLMGVPVLVSANPLMCDKKAFAAIGNPPFPKTWDELLALAPRFKEAGIYATNYYGGADASLNQSFYPVLWQAGGQVFGKDGRSVAFNDQSGVDALTFVKKLADGGYIDKEQITTTPASLEQTALAQNKVACTWQNVPADVKSFWGKENIEILPPLSRKSPVGYGTVGTLSVLQGAKSKPAAALWLSWVAQPEVIKAYDVASGYYSPQKDSAGLYPDDPVQTAMEKTVPTMTVGQLNPKSRDVMGVLNPEIQAALLGKKPPKQALDDAAKVAATQLGG